MIPSVLFTIANYYYFFAIQSNFNSCPHSDEYMRRRTGSALVQVMACRLFGARPLTEPMLAYCQLDSWEQISVKFEKEFYNFHSRKCIWKCPPPKWRSCCPVGRCVKRVECTYPNTSKNALIVGTFAIQVPTVRVKVGYMDLSESNPLVAA